MYDANLDPVAATGATFDCAGPDDSDRLISFDGSKVPW
jgi:hypothetical protein